MEIAVALKMVDDLTTQKPRTLIVGLGKTGFSAARYLSSAGVQVAITDSREQPPMLQELTDELPDVARFTGGFDERAFESAERLLVSPGVPLSSPLIQQAMEKGIPVLGDIELFAQNVDAPVIAITGSNGKTTVTTLVGEMAKRDGRVVGVGGNIGTPALDLLGKDFDLYVLELSSFQLESLFSLRPVASVVLNISEDHMDRYDSLDDYSQAKAGIYINASHSIINLDDDRVRQMTAHGQQTGFALSKPASENDFGLCETDQGLWLCKGEQKLLAADELRIVGKHNLSNALAALALGDAAGFSMQAMLDTLKEFSGLPHRTQFVTELNGVKWFNDSKATNVGACLAALQGLDRSDDSKTVLILGGECKDADFSELTEAVSSYCRAVVLLGRDADIIKSFIPDSVKTEKAVSLQQAVVMAGSNALSGDRVLLSPACASFDMFSGFEQRGEVFIKAVRELQS